jgi:hypothetical protein
MESRAMYHGVSVVRGSLPLHWRHRRRFRFFFGKRQQLFQIQYFDICPMLSERFSLIVTVYSDHKPESACTTGLDPCHGIFNDDGLFRLDSQASCRLQERVRGGLSLKTKAIDLMPINAHVK